jgi:hypothetical protein
LLGGRVLFVSIVFPVLGKLVLDMGDITVERNQREDSKLKEEDIDKLT